MCVFLFCGKVSSTDERDYRYRENAVNYSYKLMIKIPRTMTSLDPTALMAASWSLASLGPTFVIVND